MSRAEAMKKAGGEGEMIATRELRERGWTDVLIRDFLPIPDQVKPNPHYRTAAPMKLYGLARIQAIEASKEWKRAKKEALKRQSASHKAIERKREKTLEWARALPAPELPNAPREELLRLAIDNYNNFWAWRTDGRKWASIHDEPDFLERITVNYIRHKLSDYERRLLQAFGQVGKEKAAAVIRNKILDAIAAAYPWLKSECEAQKANQ